MDRDASKEESVDDADKRKAIEPLRSLPRYSDRERFDIVKRFVDAYIMGEVKINFPTEHDLKVSAEVLGIKKEDAAKEEMDVRKQFFGQISTFTGALDATDNNARKAMNKLFQTIINARMSDRLDGNFLTAPRLESQVCTLQRDVEDLKTQLEDLQQIWRVRELGRGDTDHGE